MSGHSKWSQIKRKKEAKDKEKGKMFSKISRLITIAVKEGGGIEDPEKNFKLRLAIAKAKEFNMPKENILRAIDRAKKEGGGGLKEVIYEAFTPEGVSLIILASTDNPNRTLTEIRTVLSHQGGKLGESGSTSFLFDRCGLVVLDKPQVTQEEALNFAEKIGALDMEEDQSSFFIYLPFDKLGYVNNFLGSLKAKSIEIDYRPKSLVKINEKETAKKVLTLIEALEELDDVERVFANFDIPDEFLK